MPEPGNADAATELGAFDVAAHGIDNTYDLMTRHQRKLWIVEVTVDNVKIGATDGAGFDLYPQFARTWPWIIAFDTYQRFPDVLKNHCFHERNQSKLRVASKLDVRKKAGKRRRRPRFKQPFSPMSDFGERINVPAFYSHANDVSALTPVNARAART